MFGFLRPSVYLRQQAFTKGVLGGSRSWMVLAVFAYSPRLLRRLFSRTEVVVAREPLRSGQILRIEGLGDLSKAERKAIRKAK
jgi:CRISPR/Cas system CMR-associated protein Cmr3 (group 5 of RAMP superfamily)